jgi:outer membrane receptor for ferrienterochelin and colicins
MAAEYGLILIDGKRIPNAERNISSSPATRNRWVAIENIERIEIIRGAASSLYGADALSGVINIITKEPTEEWQSSVTLGARGVKGEGGNGSGINIATGGAINDKVAMRLSVDHQDDASVEDEDGLSIRSKRRITNTQLGFNIDLDAQSKLDLDFLYGEETALDTDVPSRGGDGINELKQVKQLITANYSTKVGDFNTNTSLSLGETTIKEGTDDWKIADDNIGFEIDGVITESQYLSGGVSYRREKADRYDLSFSDTFKSTSGYLQDVIDINENNSLTLGFSFEDHNKYGAKVSPKLYWNWGVNDSWTVKAGYSEGRINPAIREGSSNYEVSGGTRGGFTRIYKGNDDLNPEESKTVELSASYSAGSLTGSIGVFSSDVDNLITTQASTVGTLITNLYSNVKKTKIRGLEGDVTWQVNDLSKVSFNYTFLDAENRSGDDIGKDIARRPNHTANLNFSHHLNVVDANISLGLKAVSSQYTNADNSEEIAGHGLVNFGVVKDLTDNIDLTFNINNVADRQVFDGAEAIEVGREYRLSLTGRF